MGDQVQLKSGGPTMTVEAILTTDFSGDADRFRCVWFAGKKLESGGFPYDSVKLVPDEQ